MGNSITRPLERVNMSRCFSSERELRDVKRNKPSGLNEAEGKYGVPEPELDCTN